MVAEHSVSTSLDVPTLIFVAVCLAATLGLCLIFAWLQQRNVRAFAWWGSAYLIGASSVALWSAPTQLVMVPPVIPAASIFIACGMVWNGVRVFHGRRILPVAIFSGALFWLIFAVLPGSAAHTIMRIGFGMVVIAAYTFAIAFELGRERRKTHYSKIATIVVPFLHAGIFLLPLGMRALLPEMLAERWLTVFALESVIYAVGTAIIMLLTVKDQAVAIHRTAANSDPLTGLLNRRAFLENARDLCIRQGKKGQHVTLMMFDLDHFKSINDRFGHAVGDDVLELFARVATTSMRATDIVGRIGGEEFAAIVPGDLNVAGIIAERVRASFEIAGAMVGEQAIGATVSIGGASSCAPVMEVAQLLGCADDALYRAKRGGRNRFFAATEENATDVVLPAAAKPPAARLASAEAPTPVPA